MFQRAGRRPAGKLRCGSRAVPASSHYGYRRGHRGDGDFAAGAGPRAAGDRRQRGRGYYRDLCFKVNAHVRGTPEEIGDGGFTDWTAKLVANSKERLLISGIGLDRLAAFADRQDQGFRHPGTGLSARRKTSATLRLA